MILALVKNGLLASTDQVVLSLIKQIGTFPQNKGK